MFNFFKKKEENNESKAQNSGFGLLKNALSNTANSLIDSVVGVVTGDTIPDEFELEDIESMLRENPTQARKAAMSAHSTLFLVEMGDFLVERINHGLDYSLEV